MGSKIVINSILKLTYEKGMPKNPVVGGRYNFKLLGERIYQFSPILVTLVHEIDEKWKFIGQATILRQTIDAEAHLTTGEYQIVRLFPEEVARLISIYEAPEGESYFDDPELTELAVVGKHNGKGLNGK